MTETNERVTVDFDSESYYLDGEYWGSWDNYGEEMADKINELLYDENLQWKEENKKLKEKIQLLQGELNADAKQYKIFIDIIDEADDLICSHLSKHYQRKWRSFCKNKEYDFE